MATTKQMMVRTLIECGVDSVFTLPGYGITRSLDAFYEHKDKIKVVLTRSEQIGSIMAQVVGKLTGKPGVYMGQGPFAATTGGFGILESYFAGTPMVVITETSDYNGYGQYGVYQTMTGDYGAADIRAMMKAMTKYSTYADQPIDAIYGLQLAYKHASLPRMGPAAVILKTPIIGQEVDTDANIKLYPSSGYMAYTPARPDAHAVKQLAGMINEAKNPIIIAGNGAQQETSRQLIAQIASEYGIAVATSYNGKGVIDETAEFAVGMLGNWGNINSNHTLEQADLIVVLGASLAPDYTKMRDAKLIRPHDQKIVQVDIDQRNAGWVYPVDLAITGDVSDVLTMLLKENLSTTQRASRLAHIQAIKEKSGYGSFPHYTPASEGKVHMADISRELGKQLTKDDMVTLDAGTNRIWMTSTLQIKHPGQLVVPGGIGGMGWGAPAAAATKYVYRHKRVFSVIGDGGFAMTMSVLATCVQENLPITIIVANNSGLGMVRDNMGKNRIAVDFGDVDFAKIAQGMGCIGYRVRTSAELADAINMSSHSDLPVVIDALVDENASHISVSDYRK